MSEQPVVRRRRRVVYLVGKHRKAETKPPKKPVKPESVTHNAQPPAETSEPVKQAVSNKQKKHESRQAFLDSLHCAHFYKFRRHCINRLRKKFPYLFNHPKPLAIGIDKELMATLDNEIDKIKTKRGISYWCNSQLYLQRMTKGGPRYNLSGKCGMVDQKHVHRSKMKIKRMKQNANKNNKNKPDTIE